MSEQYPTDEIPNSNPNFENTPTILEDAIAEGHVVESIHRLHGAADAISYSTHAIGALNASMKGYAYGVMLTYSQGWMTQEDEFVVASPEPSTPTSSILMEFVLIDKHIAAVLAPVALIEKGDDTSDGYLVIPVTAIKNYTYMETLRTA